MKKIGITGGAGSGKTYVCQLASKNFGWPIIDSDTITRNLMNVGSPMLNEIFETFGLEYRQEDGNLNRAKMAELVFNNPDELKKLNAITHPASMNKIKQLLNEYEAQGTELVIVETALADRVNYSEFCEELWLVYATEETRYGRLHSQRGYSSEHIQKVMESQATLAGYSRICNRIIINEDSTSEEELLRQIKFFYSIL